MTQKWPQLKHSKEFLGVFAKSQKVTISFVTSVHPSAWYQLSTHCTNFCEIWYSIYLLKYVKKI